MRSSCRRLTLAVVVAFLVLLMGCHHTSPVAQLGPLNINLSYNNGSCQQNGSSGVIDVYQNQSVTYQGATVLSQFQVQFATCPFSSCPVTSPNGAPVTPGQPNPGTAGNTYYYSSVMINNQPCNGVGAMGLRIKSP
jgi:hypothetical protein